MCPWRRCRWGPRCRWRVYLSLSSHSGRSCGKRRETSETWHCRWLGWWRCWGRCRFCRKARTSCPNRPCPGRSWPPPECGTASRAGRRGLPPLPASWSPAVGRKEKLWELLLHMGKLVLFINAGLWPHSISCPLSSWPRDMTDYSSVTNPPWSLSLTSRTMWKERKLLSTQELPLSELLLQIEEVPIINVALILITNLSTSLLVVTLWELLSAYALLISGMKPAAEVEYF